jgi:hypothetical protein
VDLLLHFCFVHPALKAAKARLIHRGGLAATSSRFQISAPWGPLADLRVTDCSSAGAPFTFFNTLAAIPPCGGFMYIYMPNPLFQTPSTTAVIFFDLHKAPAQFRRSRGNG